MEDSREEKIEHVIQMLKLIERKHLKHVANEAFRSSLKKHLWFLFHLFCQTTVYLRNLEFVK